MCGLVGIAGDLAFKDEATMKRLLLLDYFRGPDSTGFAAIRNDNAVKLAKLPSHPLDLFDSTKFKDALNGMQSRVFIGHNRAATRGVINHSNAHPFQYDHIVGCHNGTLEYASTSAIEKELGEKFSVDSQAIIASIAMIGVEKTLPLMQGAWSLVWYDLKEGTLNFLRNKERPLWYAYDEDFKRLFWASEYPMINSAVELGSGPKLYKETDTGFKFWATEEDIHYSFDVEALKKGGSRPKPKAKILKGKEPKPVVASGGADPFNRSSGMVTDWHPPLSSTTGSKTHSNTGPVLGSNTRPKSVMHLIGDPDNPLAGYFDEEQFKQLAKYGCSFCLGKVEFRDRGIVIFERDDILLCKDCSGGHGMNPSRIYVKNMDQLL